MIYVLDIFIGKVIFINLDSFDPNLILYLILSLLTLILINIG